MTLEDFLKSFENRSRRIVIQSLSAKDWLAYYEKAKASVEKYPDGPPLHCKVRTLRAGFGAWAGAIRTLDGYYSPNQEYYNLRDDMDRSPHARGYLSNVTYWWQDFEVIEGIQ